MIITFDIPSAHVSRVVQAIKAAHPIPPEDEGSFTDNQWAKEAVRRVIVRLVKRHEGSAADQVARDAVPDGVVT